MSLTPSPLRLIPLLLLLPPAVTHAQTAARTDGVVAPAAPVAIDEGKVTDPHLRTLYTRSKWRALWSPQSAQALTAAIGDRSRHGLDHVAFALDGTGDPGSADADVALSRVALAYAQALAVGRVDPATLHEVYSLPRPTIDIVAGLGRALATQTLAGWLDSLAPQDADYRALSEAYLRFSRAATTAMPAETLSGGIIRVGDRDARVAAIAGQLAESGYLAAAAPVTAYDPGAPASPPAAADATLYTAAMAEALKGLQTDYGIAADGVVGPATLKVLNLGPGDRARSLAVALERRRWLSRTPPATRIDVNTAAAQLRYYRDGTLTDTRKVVVGEPGHETPALASPIFRLVANPTWTVPKSIQTGEMANVGSDYLQAHNMVLRDGWIVQQPGPDNALGLVKFDMANDQAIYLHDTSAPALFDRSQRHLSHGCVRVEDALGFAEMLATDEGVADAWQAAQASGEMTFVPLPTRIPVRLLYHNVYINDDGAIAFRTDPYGWNDAIAEQLGFAKASARRAEARGIDVGP